jgi:hypothetical protein
VGKVLPKAGWPDIVEIRIVVFHNGKPGVFHPEKKTAGPAGGFAERATDQ